MKKILFLSVALVLLTSLVFIACRKYNFNEKPRLQVFLTDDPGDYDAVYIDVKDVMINVTGDSVTGWQSLTGVNAGVYDLLKLINDEDTLLADAIIPTGRLQQLRLVLGSENYVKLEGVAELIKLETPSAQQSGLKLNIHLDVVDGVLYKIILDFDVARSIVKTGNKKYILKPLIRTVLEAIGGSVKGVVMPKTFTSIVYAVQNLDTIASTFTNSEGRYLIKGISAGAYSVHYHPLDSLYKDSIRTGIIINTGQMTLIDTTVLHQ
ncbi:MAG: DUF4382 domain-containing protein [Chitinophagaceae bacterium]|nr:MAG: DUF4382 domain-containing protein [Chitinophagaceae bacterium]